MASATSSSLATLILSPCAPTLPLPMKISWKGPFLLGHMAKQLVAPLPHHRGSVRSLPLSILTIYQYPMSQSFGPIGLAGKGHPSTYITWGSGALGGSFVTPPFHSASP